MTVPVTPPANTSGSDCWTIRLRRRSRPFSMNVEHRIDRKELKLLGKRVPGNLRAVRTPFRGSGRRRLPVPPAALRTVRPGEGRFAGGDGWRLRRRRGCARQVDRTARAALRMWRAVQHGGPGPLPQMQVQRLERGPAWTFRHVRLRAEEGRNRPAGSGHKRIASNPSKPVLREER